MLTFVKFGGVTVGTGVVLGLSVVAWLYLNPQGDDLANTGGGSVVLGAQAAGDESDPAPLVVSRAGETERSAAPTPRPLRVDAQTDSIPLSLDPQDETGGARSTSTPASAVPGPSDFAQYEVYKDKTTALFGDMVVGTGAAVAEGSTVTVQYTGWLTDGTQFDASTPERPFSFVEGAHGVISGWEEGLFGMKVGGKRRLIVPPTSGYGSAGVTSGGKVVIPPDAVLVFDVELVAVK